MTTTTADEVEGSTARADGVFAALLAELRAEAEASYRAVEGERGGALVAGAGASQRDDGAERGSPQAIVQLPLPGLGARALFVGADARAPLDDPPASTDGERWTTREPLADRKRPLLRRRADRLHGLKARRELLHRAPAGSLSVDDMEPREESLRTRCVRPSLRFQAHHDLVVVPGGPSREGVHVELRELDAVVAESGVGPIAEVERVRVLKPAGVVAHLQALDRALCLHD